MDSSGDSAADLQRDMRAFSEGDSRTDSCGDWESDFPADSYRDSDAGLHRDSRRDLPEDFRGDFDCDSRATEEGTPKRNLPQSRKGAQRGLGGRNQTRCNHGCRRFSKGGI